MNGKKSKILWRLSLSEENQNTGRFSYLLPFPAPLFESKNDQKKWSRKRWPENNAKSFRAEYIPAIATFFGIFLIQKQEGGNPTIMATTSSTK